MALGIGAGRVNSAVARNGTSLSLVLIPEFCLVICMQDLYQKCKSEVSPPEMGPTFGGNHATSDINPASKRCKSVVSPPETGFNIWCNHATSDINPA